MTLYDYIQYFSFIAIFIHARRSIRQKKDQAWLKRMGSKRHFTSIEILEYQELKIQPTTNIKVIPEMNLSQKKSLGLANSSYIRAWVILQRLHPFTCADARPYRAKLFSITPPKKRPLTDKEVLGKTQGVKYLQNGLQERSYFRGKRYTKNWWDYRGRFRGVFFGGGFFLDGVVIILYVQVQQCNIL